MIQSQMGTITLNPDAIECVNRVNDRDDGVFRIVILTRGREYVMGTWVNETDRDDEYDAILKYLRGEKKRIHKIQMDDAYVESVDSLKLPEEIEDVDEEGGMIVDGE